MGPMVVPVVQAVAAAAAGAVAAKAMAPDAPKPPEKTEAQERDEAMMRKDAYQQQLKSEREKTARARGASGRRTLQYTPQGVGIGSTKLGGGM